MCALITVMATVPIHLLSLEHLVTPFFLEMQISTEANNSHDVTAPLLLRRASGALSDTRVHVYTCMCAHARHAPLHSKCARNHLHWSVAAGNDQAPCSSDKVREDQDVAALPGETS